MAAFCWRAMVGRAGQRLVIVLHAIEENGAHRYLQSYYGHCDEILVDVGNEVRRGQQIATVGTGGGRYFAASPF